MKFLNTKKQLSILRNIRRLILLILSFCDAFLQISISHFPKLRSELIQIIDFKKFAVLSATISDSEKHSV